MHAFQKVHEILINSKPSGFFFKHNPLNNPSYICIYIYRATVSSISCNKLDTNGAVV